MRPPAHGDHEEEARPADPVPGRTAEKEAIAATGAQDDPTPAGPEAPYRHLRVWAESFELAIEILQCTRGIDEAGGRWLAGRMIDASSRVPVAVARGQSSGSATVFIRNLHEALSDISEVENHLLMCAELGYLGQERVRGFAARIRRIRRMTAALIRRLGLAPAASGTAREASGRRPAGKGQAGSALLIAMIVSAALGVLGLALLRVADIESRISTLDRDRARVLLVAETGARAVKAWFDAPISGAPSPVSAVRHAFLSRFDLRDPSALITTRRLIDADGDPTTAAVAADGTTGREYYRQGRLVSAPFPHLDFFQKPWRGDAVTTLLGTERGPDLVIEDQPGTIDLIDEINAALFTRQEETGRIERIEIYAPPMEPGGAGPSRFGFVTIKVTAARYRALDRTLGLPQAPPGARPVTRAVVRAGLAEIPTNAPHGPLESCGSLVARGRLRAQWGRVLAVGDITLPDHMDRLDGAVASGYPYASFTRHITGSAPGGVLAGWLADPDDSIEDPWLKVVAGGDLVGWSTLPDQPLPYDPARGVDLDHSNLFQRVAGVACPSFDYTTWKSLVTTRLPSERHVHYYSYDRASGAFRENGAGPARSVRDWTDGREGIFFFDTVDGRPPNSSNLTPPVSITSGSWSAAGLIYLNAVSFEADSIAGTTRVLLPPGEPYDDRDHDLRYDPTEDFVNLAYATAAGTGTPADRMLKNPVAAGTMAATSPDGETYTIGTSATRDAKGSPVLAEINMFGVLFNAGDIVAEGNAAHYGSLVAGGDVVQRTWGADTPVVYFDERLNTGEWPPPEIAMPRTYVTFWQTSHP